MARACSSGAPVPPNGEVTPTPNLVSPCPSSPLLSPPLPSTLSYSGVGASQVLVVFPPFPGSVRAQRAFAPAWGVPPPSPAGLGPASLSIPPPCMLCAGGAGCSGGLLGALFGFWVSPRPCMPCARCTRYSGGAPSSASCLQEFPYSRSGMPCARSAHCLTGGPPLHLGSAYTPLARAVRPLPPSSSWLGGSPPSWLVITCAGSAY